MFQFPDDVDAAYTATIDRRTTRDGGRHREIAS